MSHSNSLVDNDYRPAEWRQYKMQPPPHEAFRLTPVDDNHFRTVLRQTINSAWDELLQLCEDVGLPQHPEMAAIRKVRQTFLYRHD